MKTGGYFTLHWVTCQPTIANDPEPRKVSDTTVSSTASRDYLGQGFGVMSSGLYKVGPEARYKWSYGGPPINGLMNKELGL